MENIVIDFQENAKKENTKVFPYFVVIEKSKSKKIRIPCSSEAIAKKVQISLEGLKNLQVNLTT